jgi:hypothetical protein
LLEGDDDDSGRRQTARANSLDIMPLGRGDLLSDVRVVPVRPACSAWTALLMWKDAQRALERDG